MVVRWCRVVWLFRINKAGMYAQALTKLKAQPYSGIKPYFFVTQAPHPVQVRRRQHAKTPGDSLIPRSNRLNPGLPFCETSLPGPGKHYPAIIRLDHGPSCFRQVLNSFNQDSLDRMRISPFTCRRQRVYFRSEEHTSELQSLMRISYAVFCLKKKKKTKH